jgi:Ca-activated chloride channel homolog
MQNPIDVRCAVDRQYIKSNSRGSVFMAIEIDSLKKSEDSFNISNLSLIIDCSSSMRGEKFKQAKESALDLFGILGDKDYLSIISFHKSAKVSLRSSRKSESESAENMIRNLQLGIGTNIYEGLALAYKEISKQTIKADDDNKKKKSITRRIILLTDGQASVGKMEEKDFVSLSKKIRDDGITITTIGIGDDYDQQLLHAIAENGGGVPYHVNDAIDLHRIFSKQADELSGTALISPTFTITMMPGAKIQDVYTVTPTLRKQNVDKSNNSRYVARLKDIIIGQGQTLALRVEVPERSPGIYRLAIIELNDLVRNIEVEYTENPLLYNRETDLYPRMMLTCSEATSLLNKGVQAGDDETIRNAGTLMNHLSREKEFEDVMTKRPLIKKMAATIRRVIERISQGHPLTESEKREAIHDTATFFR